MRIFDQLKMSSGISWGKLKRQRKLKTNQKSQRMTWEHRDTQGPEQTQEHRRQKERQTKLTDDTQVHREKSRQRQELGS